MHADHSHGTDTNGRLVEEEFSPSPRGAPIAKVEKYDWKIRDTQGRFEWIDKNSLTVDHAYQRTRISRNRVLNLARNWSWVACGCLIVGVRPDGVRVVIEGQHRWLAARKRVDIQLLPCLLFEVTSKTAEAVGFLDANCNRGPVKAFDKFNSMVAAGDPHAQAVKSMVEASGFAFDEGPRGRCVGCVGTLLGIVQIDPASAQVAWDVTALLYQSRPDSPHNEVVAGLAGVERMLRRRDLGSLLDKQNLQTLLRVGVNSIREKIAQTKALLGKGGEKASAQGVIHILNHKRHGRNRLPDVYGEKE